MLLLLAWKLAPVCTRPNKFNINFHACNYFFTTRRLFKRRAVYIRTVLHVVSIMSTKSDLQSCSFHQTVVKHSQMCKKILCYRWAAWQKQAIIRIMTSSHVAAVPKSLVPATWLTPGSLWETACWADCVCRTEHGRRVNISGSRRRRRCWRHYSIPTSWGSTTTSRNSRHVASE